MTQEEPVTGATTRIGYRWKICLVRASKHLLVCQNEGGGRGKLDKELLCGTRRVLRPPAGVVQKAPRPSTSELLLPILTTQGLGEPGEEGLAL